MTNEQAEKIGRALLAAGCGWRSGMAAVYAGQLGRVYLGSGRVLCWQGEGNTLGYISGFDRMADTVGAWPDIRDAATRGVLLEIVRERWDDPTAYMRYSPHWGAWYAYVKGDAVAGANNSEAEAFIAALEAAPRSEVW